MFLAKQAALISEASALGSALPSHPLNTLTQRYGAYKRTKTEYDCCKQTLLDQISNSTRKMTNFQNSLQLIEENKITEYLNKLNELMPSIKALPANQAFDVVKDFLDNSAQMAIYLQSCQINSGLDVLVSKQMSAVQLSLETLIEYGRITRFHPPCAHSYHRITKYTEWCEYLLKHETIQDCRDIVTQFQSTFGKNAINKIPVQQVVSFSYQLQTNVRESEFKLQKLLDRLNVESDSDSMPNIIHQTNQFEDARRSIRIFLEDQTIDKRFNVLGLHCVTITMLCDLNKRLLMMESASANSGDNMVDLTFNGNWVLDELYAHSAIMCELVSIIESAHREHGMEPFTNEFMCAAQCLREFQNSHETVRQFNEHFTTTALNDALHGVISENKSVMDLISALSNFESSLQSIPELLAALNLHLRRNAITPSRISTPTFSGTNVEATSHQACADVYLLRQKYDSLKSELEMSDTINAGGKLFLLLNGYFEKLDDDYDRLVDCLQYLAVEDDWRKIDQIKNSIELAVSGIFVFSFLDLKYNSELFFCRHWHSVRLHVRFSRTFSS